MMTRVEHCAVIKNAHICQNTVWMKPVCWEENDNSDDQFTFCVSLTEQYLQGGTLQIGSLTGHNTKRLKHRGDFLCHMSQQSESLRCGCLTQ